MTSKYYEGNLGESRTLCPQPKKGRMAVIPNPTPVSLILCEQVIVDQSSHNPSPINIFTGLAVESFPSSPQRFSVFAALTDSQGVGRLELRGIRLDTGEQFYSQKYTIDFPDRATVVNVNIRLRNIRFPVAGVYEFLLLIDDHLMAQRRLRVYPVSLSS
jgi:hypothetical protein